MTILSMHQNKYFILGKGIHPLADSACGTSIYRRAFSAASPKKFISFFSGAMGLDIGIEKAGFELAGALEFNPQACETIRLNKPSLPLIEGDIKDWSGDAILRQFNINKDDVTLIAGGPPCPSFSTAGKRQAFNDPRGQVMFDYLRIVNEIHPPFFIMENVRGILSAALEHAKWTEADARVGNAEYGTVLKLLNKEFAKMGYTVTAELVNAANYGTPQKRERVVFLGSRDGFQMSMPLGGFSGSDDGMLPPWRTLGDAVSGLQEEAAEFLPYTENRAAIFALLGEGQNWRNLPKEIQPKALGGAWTSGGGKVGFFRRLSFGEPAPTLTTSPLQKSTALCHPTRIRPLSVQEYARIQQFPDTWQFSGSTEDKYRQIGNAVPVGLGFAIGRAVMRYVLNYYPMEVPNGI